MLGHFPHGIIELLRLHVSTGILTKWIKTNVKEKFLTFNIARIYIVMNCYSLNYIEPLFSDSLLYFSLFLVIYLIFEYINRYIPLKFYRYLH